MCNRLTQRSLLLVPCNPVQLVTCYLERRWAHQVITIGPRDTLKGNYLAWHLIGYGKHPFIHRYITVGFTTLFNRIQIVMGILNKQNTN